MGVTYFRHVVVDIIALKEAPDGLYEAYCKKRKFRTQKVANPAVVSPAELEYLDPDKNMHRLLSELNSAGRGRSYPKDGIVYRARDEFSYMRSKLLRVVLRCIENGGRADYAERYDFDTLFSHALVLVRADCTLYNTPSTRHSAGNLVSST